MSFDPTISEWGNPPKVLVKSGMLRESGAFLVYKCRL